MTEPQPLCVYEKRDPHIAIIRLNRPEKKNAISRDLYWALDECWQKAKADDDVWSIILTGTADAFCVGGDLKENLAFAKGEMKGPSPDPGLFKPAPAADAQTDHRRDQRLCRRRRIQLGLSCHIRYCVPASKFGCSEVRWSHMAAWPSYVCQLPTGWAYWFALTGQMIDAETAFRLGLVQKICEPDKLIDDCVELATTINRNGRLIAAAHRGIHRRQASLRDSGMGKRLRSAPRILRPSAPEQRLRRRFRRIFRTTQTGVFARVLRRQNQTAGSAGPDK